MEPSLQLRAAVYAPKDAVYLRSDGSIGFSPRGTQQLDFGSNLTIAPVMDIDYLGKEEFHPSQKTKTVEKLRALAAKHHKHSEAYGVSVEEYLESITGIAMSAYVFQKCGGQPEMQMMLGFFAGSVPFEAVQERVHRFFEPLSESERTQLLQESERFIQNTLSSELHWLGFSPQEIRALININPDMSPPEDDFFVDRISKGLKGLAENPHTAPTLFDRVSEVIQRDIGAPPPVAVTLVADNRGVHPMGSTHLPWQFPASERIREKLHDVFAGFERGTQQFLAQPLRDPDYTVLMVPEDTVTSVLPRLLGASRRAQGTHQGGNKTIYIATETPQDGKFTFEQTLGRPSPIFLKNVSFNSAPDKTSDIRHVTAEELAHAATHIVFENAGFPYSRSDRSARAGIESLGKQMEGNPALQKVINYSEGFDNKAIMHKEMPVKGLVVRAVEGEEALRKAWPEMATFVERFMLEPAKKIIQQREGGTGVF